MTLIVFFCCSLSLLIFKNQLNISIKSTKSLRVILVGFRTKYDRIWRRRAMNDEICVTLGFVVASRARRETIVVTVYRTLASIRKAEVVLVRLATCLTSIVIF